MIQIFGNHFFPLTYINWKINTSCEFHFRIWIFFISASTVPGTWKALTTRLLNEHLLTYFAILIHSVDVIKILTHTSIRSSRPSYLVIMFQENPDYSLHTFCFNRLPGKLEQVLQSICWGGSFTQIYVERCRFTWFCQSEFLGCNFLLLLLQGSREGKTWKHRVCKSNTASFPYTN